MDVPAYYEIKEENGKVKDVFEGLKEHSVRTAAAGLALFGRELGSLREAFVLAAILHDVGKANRRSLRQYESLKKSMRPGKVSFRCHEVLSAQVVLELKKRLGDVYEPVFYAVLRHHHAMRSLVEDCLDKLESLDLVLEDVGLLKELIPPLGGLRGTTPDRDVIFHEADQLENKGKAYVLAGFLSLADSAAAFLKRRQDSSGKPSKFVELSLKERGWSAERLAEEIGRLEPEVIEIVKRYF